MYGYQDYLKEKDALPMEQAADIYRRICEAIDPNDEDDNEIFRDFLAEAVKYANIRAGWSLLSMEEKRDTDDNRTACHNKVIFRLNILSRYLATKGKDISWREELGDEADHRKRIGDFACYSALIEGLNAR